ncbi:MAG: archaeosortase/exosortase family protein [Candidatus Binatia bacterium]
MPAGPGDRLTPPRMFALRFFLFLAAASVLAWAVALPMRLSVPQRWLAAAATWLAGLAGSGATTRGDQIHVSGLIVHINFECTGMYVLLILFVFLLAYPASWRDRLTGAAIGAVALTALNIFRIAVLIRAAELQPALFAYLHEYVWQGVFLVLTIAYAMGWVQRTR